jgi:hypothetical protein
MKQFHTFYISQLPRKLFHQIKYLAIKALGPTFRKCNIPITEHDQFIAAYNSTCIKAGLMKRCVWTATNLLDVYTVDGVMSNNFLDVFQFLYICN